MDGCAGLHARGSKQRASIVKCGSRSLRRADSDVMGRALCQPRRRVLRDAAHHVFWFYRYANPALFPHDLSIEYFASDSVAPHGYRALYAILAHWFDAQRVAEWVAFVLVALSGGLAWLLGASIKVGSAGCHRSACRHFLGVPVAPDRPDLANGISAQLRAPDHAALSLRACSASLQVGGRVVACGGARLPRHHRSPGTCIGSRVPNRSCS